MSEVKTNKISSLASNNNITIDPDGTGDTIIASGNLGVGTTSPDADLSLISPVYSSGGTGNGIRFQNQNNSADAIIQSYYSSTSSSALLHSSNVYLSTGASFTPFDTNKPSSYMLQNTNGNIEFGNSSTGSPSEKMRLDSSGNLLVGQSSTTVPGAGNTTAGTSIRGTDGVFISRTTSDTGASALQVNKTTGTGAIINLSSGGTTAGSVGVANTSEVYFTASGGNGTGLYMSNGSTVVPMKNGSVSDNTVDCGHPSYRFDNIRATNGTIQTSDQNEKQQIASLTTAEITAAKAISALFKTFKWKDKVESKGNAARIHTGVIAQEVQTAMSNAGLDAADYAFWCSDTWTDDDGNSQTRMGIRYPELLAFVGAATEQRLANIESRLTALEAE